jgi:prepilin-type N-terminal cleavage/methylation domain-containing protein
MHFSGTHSINTHQRRSAAPPEAGFTLIELLTAVLVFGLITTLGVFALRHFWFVQSLERGKAEVVTQMRQAQQQAMSESHPLVYGVYFEPGATSWGVVKYNPTETSGNRCAIVQEFRFDGGVRSINPNFEIADTSAMRSECDVKFPSTPNPQKYVFFYPRGSATPGTVTLRSFEGDDNYLIEVKGVTGRVVAP